MNGRLRTFAAGLISVVAAALFGVVWMKKLELDRELRPLEKLGWGKQAGVAIDRELR